MAARRLKFKPKPLVGLIRRNKDHNEQDILKDNDSTNSENERANNINETVPNSKDSEHLDSDKSKDNIENTSCSEGSRHIEGEALTSTDNSTVNESNLNKSVLCEKIVHEDDNNSTVQSDLKCDINSKIKTVLSGHGSDVCNTNSTISGVNNYINSNTEILDNFAQSSSDRVEDVNDSINVVGQPSNKLNDSSLERSFPNVSHKTVDSDKLFRNSVISKTLGVNEPQIANNDVIDKKENKGNNQRGLSRFNKPRLKPSLSNIVRNKKDSTIDANKNDIKSNLLSEIKSSSSVQVDNAKVVPESENNVITESNNFNAIAEEPIVTDLQETHNEGVSEETSTCVSSTVQDYPKATDNSDLVKDVEFSDRTLHPIQPEESISAPTIECNIDDGSVRTPVKIFQPNKRQRSHGHSYNSLTIKAMQSFKDKFKDGLVDKSKLMMRDLIFYNPTTNPMPPRQASKFKKDEKVDPITKMDSLVTEMLEEEKVDDVGNEETDSLPVPQVKVGPDGKIIIDPKSLVIEATGVQKNRENLEKSEVVQENEFSYSKFHRKKVRRSEWNAEETLLFYKALNDLGADFSLMQSLFPKRTRRDLKLKFKKEERINCNLIDKAMTSCGTFDFKALENELKKDREERVKKLDEQKKLAEQKKRQVLVEKKSLKKIVKRKSAADREFDYSDQGITRMGRDYETKVKELMKKETFNSSEPLIHSVKKRKRSKNGTRRRRKVAKSSDNENDETCKNTPMFDFRLKGSFVDNDDEIDSCDDTSPHATVDNGDDEGDTDDDFHTRVFKKTRSGRQPKVRTLKDPATVEYINKLKKFKLAEDEEAVKDNLNPDTLIPEVPIMETVIFNDGKIRKLSNLEMQEKLENCYQLFGEPLNLTIQNENELFINDLSSNSLSNENPYVITGNEKSEIGMEVITSRPNNTISNALQIVEELTSENVVEFSLQDGNESSCFYVASKDLSDHCMSSQGYKEVVHSSQTTESDTVEYCNLDEGNSVCEIINQTEQVAVRPSIIIKTPHPETAQIQVVSKEQLSSLFSQSSNVILQNGIGGEAIEFRNNVAEESAPHSKIHCYPSSDHNYTSLIPRISEPRSTYVIVTPMNIEEFS